MHGIAYSANGFVAYLLGPFCSVFNNLPSYTVKPKIIDF
jgi:hypothetical protein